LELGIDSLVAVDLRAWFITEVGVDMPILKILGGASILELVTDAVARLPRTLLLMTLAESEPNSTPGVLVPNGLGGLDLVVESAETQPTATVFSESPKDKDDSVPIPPPPPPQPTPPTPTPAPETQIRGHFKHPSTASSVPSSDFQGPFSQSYTPVFSDISSHSQPDPEAVMNLLNSSLDAVAESMSADDVGSRAVMTLLHSEDASQG
jgi:hybrid polyketide synthase/nonribosomal peptide synthetase ACE1